MSCTIDALKNVKTTFNFYLASLGLFLLHEFVRHWDKRFPGAGDSSPQVLGLVMREDYVSSVVGLLFGFFLVLLLLQIRLLVKTLDTESASGHAANETLFASVRNFPWIASPVHELRLCRWLFWALLGFGCLVVGRMAKAHIWPEVQSENIALFVAQGYYLAVVFVAAVVLVCLLAYYVSKIRRKVESA